MNLIGKTGVANQVVEAEIGVAPRDNIAGVIIFKLHF